jgi:hypothetical protein
MLPYQIRNQLVLPDHLYNENGVAMLLACGILQDGEWNVRAYPAVPIPEGPAVLGEMCIPSLKSELKTYQYTFHWLQAAMHEAGGTVQQGEHLDYMLDPKHVPVLMCARFVVRNEAFIGPLP